MKNKKLYIKIFSAILLILIIGASIIVALYSTGTYKEIPLMI